ncbi:MAG: TonB-dependent receptor [Candidatus Neomarinimicrobiota bacterium]
MFPMILALEPGVYAYSESGNGTGYSYVSIRGFDQSRIAVMLDNVPLNDNESHQVYWVDHADILSDASDVQIQRGIGNSLYGSSAFGGSINVSTGLTAEKPGFKSNYGGGSFNTSKFSVKAQSGPLLQNKLQLQGRYSQVESDGYRDYHDSRQRAVFLGGQYVSGKLSNQFRALIGYEKTHLAWWGVGADIIDDRDERRSGYEAYLDDFLQQIYSLNTSWQIRDDLALSNVTYLVQGSGYYENYESSVYNLTAGDDSSAVTDYRDFLTGFNLDDYWVAGDSAQALEFTRRKWIVNAYYGITPTVTFSQNNVRLDIGGELRFYGGDHFSEMHDLPDPENSGTLLESPRKYYQYLGQKRLATGFIHLVYRPVENLRLVGDLQLQNIHWTLDQEKIGAAAGHQLQADWTFINPRLGIIHQLNDNISVFANYGRGQKEPADNQIIEADDMFSEPVLAAAEKIDDFELGGNFQWKSFNGSVNLYQINFKNEQLKNIDVEQEGEYTYYSAAGTRHQGLEFELNYQPFTGLTTGVNGSINDHYFTGGSAKGEYLPGVPRNLFNIWCRAEVFDKWSLSASLRQVGRQNMPAVSSAVSGETVDAYTLVDLSISRTFGIFEMALRINNVFDTLYSTAGYDWDGWLYYWPGATRNGYLSLAVKL